MGTMANVINLIAANTPCFSYGDTAAKRLRKGVLHAKGV